MHSEPISAAHQFGLRAIGRQEGNEFPSNLDSNFVQSCSGQNTFLITGVDGEAIEVRGLGIYTQRNFVGFRHSVLFYPPGSTSRSSILERDFNLQVIRLRQFPVRSNLSALLISQDDILDAGSAIGLHLQGILAANDERTLICCRDTPLCRMCALQIEIGPSKRLISPKAIQFSVTASGKLADLNHMRIDYEATTCGIGERRQLNGGAVLGLHTHGKIMCQGG